LYPRALSGANDQRWRALHGARSRAKERSVTIEEPEMVERHDLSAAEIDRLEDLIYDYNVARTGTSDAAQFGFTMNAGDRMVGAIAGFTWAGFCEVRQLWVDDEYRSRGYGTRLLIAAIDEARARMCTSIYLATYSFQAPQFYERFGFERVAVIEGRPVGHRDIFMRLAL
jgi:N-acetylglutamate synthase-like GNAT family acetyltransferase